MLHRISNFKNVDLLGLLHRLVFVFIFFSLHEYGKYEIFFHNSFLSHISNPVTYENLYYQT